jgi:hypothetical protein
MIKITKKANDTPDILKTKGKEEIEKLKLMTSEQRIKYKYSSAIYGAKTVKNKLKDIQNDKCCFCESKVSAISFGDVEHYRPKGGWVQKDGDKLTKPGYYWLAFNFENLYLSCQLCNEVYKKNYFPLQVPANRARLHTNNLSIEEPLIIDPGGNIDPSEHLEFRQEVIHGKTPTGDETIKRTGLNRDALVKQRFEYLKVLKLVAILASQNNNEGIEALKQLKELASEKSIYSLMVRNNFVSLLK